jgi:ABC-type phosphate transport system substrate-binding protein
MRRVTKPLLVIAALLAAAPAPAEEIAVIVNRDRTTQLDREEVAQIFLKKRRFWDDGTPMLPVNQSAGAATRASFDRAVFGAGARRLSVYWNRAYYGGVLPPATLASDEAVRRFVVSEPRAIGYIRADVVDTSVRVVLILTSSPP